MPRMTPGQPEAVTYDEYEELRDDGLSAVSLHPKQLYTARFRTPENIATREIYAYDLLALILTVQHLGRYSIVGAKVKDLMGWGSVEVGVNQRGLAFNHRPLPEDLDDIPYRSEYGYFVGRADGSSSKSIEKSQANRIHSPEEILLSAR